MFRNDYRATPGTVVVVAPTRRHGYARHTSPACVRRSPSAFLRQSFQICGITLGSPMVICLGGFGVFFMLSGTMTLAVSMRKPHFWADFEQSVNRGQVVGSVFLTVGVLLIIAFFAVRVYERRNCKNFLNHNVNNRGRVINLPSSQPATYPGQTDTFPGHPTTYPSQLATNPSQPSAYPSQPTSYPRQPSAYPSQPTTYPSQPAAFSCHPTAYPSTPQAAADPSNLLIDYRPEVVSGKSGLPESAIPQEYQPPPAYAPDSSPPPYSP